MINIEDLKLPPHHFDAEKGVLGCILIDADSMYACESQWLKPEDFYHKEHQTIFATMEWLRADRKTIDAVTISSELQRGEQLDQVGGIDYFYELGASVITSSVAYEYASIVKEKAVLRNILKTCNQVNADVYGNEPIANILEKIEKRIFDLTQIQMSTGLLHVKDILNRRMEEYMEIIDNPSKLDDMKVNSTYQELDNVLGGFKSGDLIIIAARPSMGKTAFVLNLMIRTAMRLKKAVSMFSLEMGAEQIVDRVISTVSGVPMHKITKGLMDANDFSAMGEAMSRISDTAMYVDDAWGLSIQEMRSKLRRQKIEKWHLDLVIVDYLQLMTAGANAHKFAGNRVQEISEISRWLKELAKELKVPIIALSQLSRNVEQRPDKRPQLSDLRESGAIEQDADAVLMLYREEYYDSYTDKKGIANIFVRKNRNGPTAEIDLYRQKETMQFLDIVKE